MLWINKPPVVDRIDVLQIVYYDGQFDDARLNVTLAISAAQAGATTLNYAEVTNLLKVVSSTTPGQYLLPPLPNAREPDDA